MVRKKEGRENIGNMRRAHKDTKQKGGAQLAFFAFFLYFSLSEGQVDVVPF
jgi:hypothetical protein